MRWEAGLGRRKQHHADAILVGCNRVLRDQKHAGKLLRERNAVRVSRLVTPFDSIPDAPACHGSGDGWIRTTDLGFMNPSL